MFDIWLDELNFTYLIIAVSVFVIFPVQLIICKKAKSIKVKLIPSAVFAVSGIFCVIMAEVVTGWDVLGYLIFAIYFAFLTAVCIVGMLVYWIYAKLKKQ
ncbi:MAG: hypothetical protein E7218_00030 [Anaerofustis stercorihominis]|nr:hypothetical protein [Anaerofustis stercorihominis]